MQQRQFRRAREESIAAEERDSREGSNRGQH